MEKELIFKFIGKAKDFNKRNIINQSFNSLLKNVIKGVNENDRNRKIK